MKIAVVAGLFTKRDMNINAGQLVCDLMNNFTKMNTINSGTIVKQKDTISALFYDLPALPAKQYPAFR